jgi:D-serine deaminase-like pyridoxal phosphate-dependent protein
VSLEIGARVRILPNHACATSAQHDRYHVVAASSRAVEAVWPRFNGW